jgi:hypothetical protein
VQRAAAFGHQLVGGGFAAALLSLSPADRARLAALLTGQAEGK